MKKVVNVLFLGGAKRVSFAEHLIQAGKNRGQEVHVFSYELQKQLPIASVGTVIEGRRWKDKDLYEHLEQTSKDYQIQVVLPFIDPAVEVAAKLKKRLPHLFIPTCDEDLCHVMFDKCLSEHWFLENGIPIPKSYQPTDSPDFPIIIKPRTGSASKGIEVIEDTGSWAKVGHKDDYVIQHYINDKEEFTVDCYVSQKGRILSIVPRIRIEIAGGEVMTTRTLRDDTLIALSEKILLHKGFRGPVTIQYIRDRQTGETFVMEINPRLGGGVIASIEAGADEARFILEEQEGVDPRPCTQWKDNTLMTRYFKEVIFHADNH